MKFTMIPETWEDTATELTAAGHEHVDEPDQAEFLVLTSGTTGIPDPLPKSVKFIHTTFAGVDSLAADGTLKNSGVRWANAAGQYDDTVAESALALLLAVFHQHKRAGVAASFDKRFEIERDTQFLIKNKTVAVIGAGGIGKTLLNLVRPFGVRTIAVNRSGREVDEADETFAMSDADHVWPQADAFILLMPLTDETRGMVDAELLAKMKQTAVVVNVGRGPLMVTDDLVHALENGVIAGAGLDVTDPEPLPAGHRLWELPNAIITPHVANTAGNIKNVVGELIVRNAEAFESGKSMITEVDVEQGY